MMCTVNFKHKHFKYNFIADLYFLPKQLGRH